MSDYPFFHDASAGSFVRARQLRKNMTPAEEELWKHIRKSQIDGFRFRRQHPVARFILDFYCHNSKLAIEVDGSIHELEDQKIFDQERDHAIHELGIKVLRFKNEEVFEKVTDVLIVIRTELRNRLMLLSKSSPNGEDLGGVNSRNGENLESKKKSSAKGEDLGGV